MSSQPFVIRVKTPQGENLDWTVQNPHLSFQEVIDAINRTFQSEEPCTAFEYEDEDGDHITVRSNDELQAMMAFHFSVITDCEERRVMAPPLAIYPRAPKSKNRHGLTINTRPAGAVPKGADSGISLQCGRHDAELRDILANGTISKDDIEYLTVLGHGHSGTVYKSRHVPTNNIMAIKVIPLDITEDVQKQILAELQILYKCDSQEIIGFYGAFFTENRISICTEFMDGGSLEMYKCIPEQILGRIAVPVVKGLNYLWSNKIMHRGVKPSNILVNTHGEVKLCDFGVSTHRHRYRNDVKPSNILVNTQGEVKLCDFGVSAQLVRSITKTYVGTNAYMAPERVLGDEYGVPSEVWSLGLFLLEMAQGRFPYPVTPREQELSAIDLLQCIVHENPPMLPKEHFSAPFVDFVQQCMQKLPRKRPQPGVLIQHPFIRSYDDGNKQIIAEWVGQQLQELRLRGESKGL